MAAHRSLPAKIVADLRTRSSVTFAIALGGLALCCPSASAQTVPLDPGPFPIVRYEQSCRTLADLAKLAGNPTEYIPLGADPDRCLSFGGEVKERYEHYTDEVFGRIGIPEENYLWSRVLLDADLHLGENFRTFLQIGHWDQVNEIRFDPISRDGFDVAQGFVDLSSATGFAENVTLRAGRQEMLLGSGRLISLREGPNTRQTYDGFRLFATWNDVARLDAFVNRPTVIRPGDFDDGPDPHQIFGGLYGTVKVDAEANFNLDGYYLRLSTTGRPFNPGPSDTRVNTVGTRLWGGVSAWDYDADAMFQFGTQRGSQILAGGIGARVGYSFPAEETFWRPRVILNADYFSGNGAVRGHEVNTFNPLFSAPVGFYDSIHEALSNLIDVYPSLKLHPTRTVALQFGADFNWRASTHDFVYATPFIPIPGTRTVPARYVSTNIVLEATWTATANLTLATTLVHMIAGPAITDAHGKNTDYATFWGRVRF